MSQDTEIRDLIQAILKARKNLRIYPENNPIYQKTLDDVYSRFKEILDYTDELKFKIRQFEILHDDQVVYENRQKDESLALLFFK
ncbi:MAG: hypothetical protein D6710_06370, partial [Nitrospirae bacterium]